MIEIRFQNFVWKIDVIRHVIRRRMTNGRANYVSCGHDGGPYDDVTVDAEGHIKFDPPVYEQRYTTAIRILEDSRWNFHFKKIVDFGCGEMKLLRLLRRLEHVEHILNVDVDETTLSSHLYRAVPLLADNLKERDRPLRVEVLKGSLIDSVENLCGVDAIVAIEVIEHLVPEVLEKVPGNIFGFIQPKLVIMSTPNQEFNVLFNGLNANGFRIDDHKFEWTRKEFQKWATNICETYENYSFATLGVGSAPLGHEELGTVTQIAIFARNDIIDRPLAQPIQNNLEDDKRPKTQYQEMFAVDFPFRIDKRTKEEKLKHEIIYYLSYAHKYESNYNHDRCLYQIPIKYLLEYAEKINASKEDVLHALVELDLKVEQEFIILTDDYVEKQYKYRGHGKFEDDTDDSSEIEAVNNKLINEQEDEDCWD